jgi:hypothetical protein
VRRNWKNPEEIKMIASNTGEFTSRIEGRKHFDNSIVPLNYF